MSDHILYSKIQTAK